MTDEEFRELIVKIVEMYQLSADTAAQLLHRILTALAEERNGTTQKERNPL